MSDKTAISWTDATWNPLVGCERVSPGCTACYAIPDAWRMSRNPNPKVSGVYRGLVELPKPHALEWVRSIRDQCVAASIPFFFKQWGGRTHASGGRLLDGRIWDEFPSTVMP